MTQFIASWVEARTGLTLGHDEDVFDMGGLDSLDFVELLEALEMRFGVVIDPLQVNDWAGLRTPAGLAAAAGSCR